MTPDHARAILASALQNRTPALANIVLRGDDMATAAMAKIDLVEEMADMVSADVWSQVEKLVDKQFIPYDPSYQTSPAQVLVENVAEIPGLAEVDAIVRRGDLPNDSGGAAVVAMAHSVGTGDGRIVAYRVKGPGIATRRARGVLQLVPRDGIYQPIDEEVLYYEPRFDVFTCAGFAFFVTATLLQSKLNAPAKAQALARDTLRVVAKNVAIDGLLELEAAVMDDPTMRNKMAQIARLLANDPGYAANLTTDKLVAFVDDNPDYDVLVVEQDGRRVLQFNPSAQHRHQIPKLLADDYLRSELTDRKYEAGSKHRVTKST